MEGTAGSTGRKFKVLRSRRKYGDIEGHLELLSQRVKKTLDDFTSLMKSGFANKAHWTNTPEQTAWMTANTWRLCLNSWSLDSRMGESFVTHSKKITTLYSPPTTTTTTHCQHIPRSPSTTQSRTNESGTQDSRTSEHKTSFLPRAAWICITVGCDYRTSTLLWISNSLPPSLPPAHSVLPLTPSSPSLVFCRHLSPHQNKNTAGHGTMYECEAALVTKPGLSLAVASRHHRSSTCARQRKRKEDF